MNEATAALFHFSCIVYSSYFQITGFSVYYEPVLGMNFMQKFYYRLNTEQQQSEAGKDLLNDLTGYSF